MKSFNQICDGDLPAMADVANAVFADDKMSWVRTPEHMRHDCARFTDFDSFGDIVTAEVDGKLVGCVRTLHWIDEDGCLVQAQVGFVHPAVLRRSIGTECCAG